MLKEITRVEFEQRYPGVSTYGLEREMPVYLEDGAILINREWNGEDYCGVVNASGEKHNYRPVQEPTEFDEDGEPMQWETLGYETW